jgi:hypothetical protein
MQWAFAFSFFKSALTDKWPGITAQYFPRLSGFSFLIGNMATPLCRCRVLYLGCAVPKITKDGLQAIQDPLKDIYPDGGAADANGIDAVRTFPKNFQATRSPFFAIFPS